MTFETALPFRKSYWKTDQDLLDSEALVKEILDRSLFGPVQDLLSRPSKSIRARLLFAGLLLGSDFREQASTNETLLQACERLEKCLEAIHSGSLIVDDIQDNSRERRGAPTLHERYGVPLALNAGNWLYFLAFDWLKHLALPASVELRLYRLFHETMHNAHLGQAIDLGTCIDEVPREQVANLCMTSLSLKTGALTALAVEAGGILGKASECRLKILREFGTQFGCALQMFDDIGNFSLPADHPKRLEDLRLRRPTWLWAAASRSSHDYSAFIEAVKRLPDEDALQEWMVRTGFLDDARRDAHSYLDQALDALFTQLKFKERFPIAISILHELAERIRTAYA